MSYLAIDTLLFISGMINAYHYLKQDELSLKTVLIGYVRRWAKFMIVIAAVMFTASVALGRLIQGPIADMYFLYFSGCSKYWWTNLLPISNFYPANYNSNCLWWTWYFAIDF